MRTRARAWRTRRADAVILLLEFASVCGIDIARAGERKMDRNRGEVSGGAGAGEGNKAVAHCGLRSRDSCSVREFARPSPSGGRAGFRPGRLANNRQKRISKLPCIAERERPTGHESERLALISWRDASCCRACEKMCTNVEIKTIVCGRTRLEMSLCATASHR